MSWIASESFGLLLITVLFLIIFYCIRHLNYFKSRNVPYLKSFPLLGTLTDVLTGRKGLYDWTEDLYKNPQFKDKPFYGIFMFHKPSLVIKDPQLIKQILVKDFNTFANHCGGSGDHDPLGQGNLFFAKDSLWRNLRKKLTPFFSSGKMKLMFPILNKISDELIEHIEEMFNEKSSIDINLKDKLGLFTTEVITNVAFGVDANAFRNENSEFKSFGKKHFDFTFHRGIELTAHFLLPEITKFFNFKFFRAEGTEFIIRSMTDVMKQREESKIQRHDLIDVLIEIKNSQIKENDAEKLPMDYLIAQAAIFFQAGQETSSGTAAFLLYELSKHIEIQQRVRDEIKEALQKSNGKLTYEMVMHETPYLQQVLTETLRIYPVLSFLDRECSNPNGYSLKPYSDFVIPYKMPIVIPIYGLQRDEKYFPDPQRFDPERFSPENINNVEPFANMPFGMGNRNCIGERFGLMQAKIAVIKILMNYRVEMTESTPKEINLAKNAMIIQSEVPIVFSLVKDKIPGV